MRSWFARALVAHGLAGVAAVDLAGVAPTFGGEEAECEREFVLFKRRFGKSYAADEEEEARYAAFRHSYGLVIAHNAQGGPFELGINEFADLTSGDFAALYGMRQGKGSNGTALRGSPSLGFHTRDVGAAVPERVDWREKGAVTRVKNQGQCGSCWAFATTGSLESAWHIATGQSPELSEQQFVDCAGKKYGIAGCDGGNLPGAGQYATETFICNEASYPYAGKHQKCATSQCRKGLPLYAVVGYKSIHVNDEAAMKDAVARQPVEAQIEADLQTFQLYKKGVFGMECGDKIDHAVLIVGYGSDGPLPYWLVKNSWGPNWGEHGYIRMKRGVPDHVGECGIRSGPGYPVVDGARAQPADVKASLIAAAAVLGAGLLVTLFCCSAKVRARLCRQGQRAPLIAPGANCAAAPPAPTGPGNRLGGGGARVLPSAPPRPPAS